MAPERTIGQMLVDLGFARTGERSNGLQRVVHVATGLEVGWFHGLTFWRHIGSQCCEVEGRRDLAMEALQ